MGRRLTRNVALRRGGNPVVLTAGSEVPDWAVGLLDDNVLEGDDDQTVGEPGGGDAVEPAGEAKPRGRARRQEG